jgi:hypothetical protein
MFDGIFGNDFVRDAFIRALQQQMRGHFTYVHQPKEEREINPEDRPKPRAQMAKVVRHKGLSADGKTTQHVVLRRLGEDTLSPMADERGQMLVMTDLREAHRAENAAKKMVSLFDVMR